MRAATDGFGVIELDDRIAGVALGHGYCAEHEWGFSWRRELGIPEKATRDCYGVACRRNAKNDLATHLFKRNNGELVLIAAPYIGSSWTLEEMISAFSRYPVKDTTVRGVPYKQLPLADVRTAWSAQGGFMIVGQTDKGGQAVEVVHNALQANRLLVGFGATPNPFAHGGVNLIDVDRTPQALIDRLAARDEDWLDLQEAAAETGIESRLIRAGRGFYALKPGWAREDEGGQVVFWLNPHEQDRFNYGWFSVEALDAWIAGEGPIIKQKP